MSIYLGDDNANAPPLDFYTAMYGAGGNDVLISAYNGLVYMNGGPGYDDCFLAGLSATAHFEGGDGNDFLVGAQNGDSLYGGNDDDVLAGGFVKAPVSLAKLHAAQGPSGNDYLEGGAGRDGCYGLDGNDTIYGGDGDDKGTVIVMYDNKPIDIQGGLFGGGGKDYVDGGRGDDWIDGGRGKDTLVGGFGKDVFDFNSIKDSAPGNKADTILDFSHAQGDRLNLSSIDARTDKVGNQTFKFIGTQAFHDKAGELRFKNGVLGGDVDGDGKPDFEVKLPHVSVFHDTDIVL